MTTLLSCGECSAALLRPLGPARTEAPSRVVAVSGGIGSGKSTVTATFASLGAVVADADAIAREIMEPGKGALAEVAARFGADLIGPDGTLDRAGLARRVFAGEGAEERVAALNAITHPAIERRAWQILSAAPAGSLAVYDVPLLLEGAGAERFDAVVIVDAPLEARIARLERRGVSPEDARARIAAQATDEQREAVATWIIDNGGSLEETAEQVRAVWEQMTAA
ncbi:MAG: dephospho-CoA kinase [Pauljensenia sp.]|nr:dephospho-CoA kinase [Pauljensenia sp.]